MPVSSVTVRLAASPDAAARARQSLREACAAFPGYLLYDAELLTSEIVTNVVKHAGGTVTIAIECDERNLAVEVADNSSEQPVVRRAAAGDLGGRGMQLVDQLAAKWGSRPRPDGAGKIVWFRLSA